MSQDSLEDGTVGQRLGNRHQSGIVGFQTGTVAVAVYLEQHADIGVVCATKLTYGHGTC